MDWKEAQKLMQCAINDAKQNYRFPTAHLTGRFSAMIENVLSSPSTLEEIRAGIIKSLTTFYCPECSREKTSSICVCKESEVV